MNTLHLTSAQEDIARASDLLKSGGLVAFPTETVYGLGANALDEAAVQGIFRAKGRPGDNPLIVHIWDKAQLEQLVVSIPANAKALMDAFWPGPLTIVMKKSPLVPDCVSANLDTVGVRMPQHPVAYDLLRACNLPIAAPSANRSGRPSPTIAAHVAEDLEGRIDAIVDGGSCCVGVESTVVDATGEHLRLLRPGGITYEQLVAVVGRVERKDTYEEGTTPASPGMKYTHYSPNATVYVVRGDFEKAVLSHANPNQKVGILCHGDFSLPPTFVLRHMGATPEQYANTLFAHLRAFDKDGVDVIYVQDVGQTGLNDAVRNRLYKSAGYQIIGE